MKQYNIRDSDGGTISKITYTHIYGYKQSERFCSRTLASEIVWILTIVKIVIIINI